ncbi:MFS transporter [uncultured Kocuria sp.]|uniref:MFS transporter n=1 Tax=uncultured Kocuria sp. TaxID=259305 RepID=UPI00260A6E8F|nr:MFS transporter [uncultured Kocuria sp.]
MLSFLGDRVYRRLFTAQVVALLGTGLLTVALGLLAFDLAGARAGAVLGTALAIKMIAYVGVAPVVNAAVARLPVKPVLVGADVLRAAMALCLPVITEVWQVYAVVFVLQAASATFTPAFQSVIPAVLPRERDYTRALSLSRLAYDLEALVSPALAAVALTVLSYHDLFLGTAGGFVASAVLVLAAAVPAGAAGRGEQGSLWHRTTLGARIFRGTPLLRSLLALDLAVAAPTALVLVNTVVYVREVMGRPETDLALALAAFGIGSMVVALCAPAALDRFGNRAVMLTGAGAIPPVLLATTLLSFRAGADTGWWALLGLWMLLGAATSAVLTPSARLLRDASDETTRPYVFTAQFSLSHACFIVTYPVAGWIGASAGLGWSAAVLTAIAVVGAGVATASWPRDPMRSSVVGEDGDREHHD